MTTSLPTFDSVLHGTALAALCLIGTAAEAADAPPKAAKPPATRVTKKPAPKPVETGPADASAEQIDAAERVYYGVYDCEFNQTVNIQKNTKYAAYVDLRSGK